MSKLTKVQRLRIEHALKSVAVAIRYLERPDVTVARRERNASTTLHFTRPPVPEGLLNSEQRGQGSYSLYEVDPFCGCDLATLGTAREQLIALLA